jgi:hypothetical protein
MHPAQGPLMKAGVDGKDTVFLLCGHSDHLGGHVGGHQHPELRYASNPDLAVSLDSTCVC